MNTQSSNTEIFSSKAFFRDVHPLTSKGYVLLVRRIGRNLEHSKVDIRDGDRVASIAVDVPDLFCSIACFSGMPLLLNFVGVRCLYIQVPDTQDNRVRVYASCKWKGLPQPNFYVIDGEKVTFFWALRDVLPKEKLHLFYLYQQKLFEMFKEFNPYRESKNLLSVVPLIGTINSKLENYVTLGTHNNDFIDNDLLEVGLLNNVPYSEVNKLRRYSLVLCELLVLFSKRRFFSSYNSSPESWLICFAEALSYFCSLEQLKRELKALAVTLENAKAWKSISNIYTKMIDNIASAAIGDGAIPYDGGYIELSNQTKFENMRNVLKISKEEIDQLGLKILSNESDIVTDMVDIFDVDLIGENNFIPLERLIMKKIS